MLLTSQDGNRACHSQTCACVNRIRKKESLAALKLHQVGHPPNAISNESHLACRSKPAHADLHSFAVRETEMRDMTIKKKTKRRKREGSPVNHKCPVQKINSDAFITLVHTIRRLTSKAPAHVLDSVDDPASQVFPDHQTSVFMANRTLPCLLLSPIIPTMNAALANCTIGQPPACTINSERERMMSH
ncbi:hypothetical protein F2P81_004635 [Scophthalmus maximus]|uniref:Uncharacterized protein n=1 Tax=Scophthalmus maximus TaxID=52904 RepID=A0A6A4TFT8_SCOMX|nr:hypothetical protein F2P81_004635 [Scophthalmus maximus]